MTGKRVVAHLAGGLGNQLFIYAAAWALARRLDAALQFDTSAFTRDWEYKRKFAVRLGCRYRTMQQPTFCIASIARLWRS